MPAHERRRPPTGPMRQAGTAARRAPGPATASARRTSGWRRVGKATPARRPRCPTTATAGWPGGRAPRGGSTRHGGGRRTRRCPLARQTSQMSESAYGGPIVTGEAVAVELRPAGIGSRGIAFAVDIAVQYAVLLGLILLGTNVIGAVDFAAGEAFVIVAF